MSVFFHQCFLLHQRAYRETSVIIDLLSETEGRVSLVCKGVRGSGKKSAMLRSVLQPFAGLAVSWSGKSDLKSLRQAEVLVPAPQFSQHQLFAALYLNELLVRLFQQGESHIDLFQEYRSAIADLALADASDMSHTEIPLRRFEFKLLATLGFEVDLAYDAGSGECVEATAFYRYTSDIGLNKVLGNSRHSDLIAGEDLLALHSHDYSRESVRRAAKKIVRIALAQHLGGKPLKSRELYSKPS